MEEWEYQQERSQRFEELLAEENRRRNPRTVTSSASVPAFENSVNVQIGEPSEAQLARAIKRARRPR